MAIFDRIRRALGAEANAAPEDAPVQGPAAQDAFRALDAPIGEQAVREAYKVLQKYKAGKANLERRIVNNEQWYKMRHWDELRGKNRRDQVEPASGWLFNSLASKHADVMDNYPSPNILARESGDENEAKMLSSVIPVILEATNFEQTYSDVARYKLKNGTGVYGVDWDKSAANGMGDISIRKVDLLSLFWEPGVTDIQSSRNVFHVELRDNDLLVEEYPQLVGKLGTSTLDVTQYVYDDAIDTSEKSAVIDWYYKKRDPETGRVILHYVKFCNDEVLFATENDPDMRLTGWYDHGLYPFVFDVLFEEEGCLAGFGYVDVGKDAQEYIDRGNQAVLQNMLANVRPRYFIRSDGAVNEAEYADQTAPFVHVNGQLGQDSIMPIEGKGLDGIYVQVLNNKIEELKEITGNRDISNGGTSSGVTAASAIAAMQEAGSKLSRDNIKASYRCFRRLVLMTIELIRQFYDLPRKFRIMGERGVVEYVMFDNAGLVPHTDERGNWRLPEFDIEVTAQKASPYAKLSQNELALQFYQLGFFNPAMTSQAILCIDMMDFDGKDDIKQKILKASQAYWQAAAMTGAAPGMEGGVAAGDTSTAAEATERDRREDVSVGGNLGAESKNTSNARRRTAEATAPR